jgi:hypothetical protein
MIKIVYIIFLVVILTITSCRQKIDYSYRSGANVRWLNPKEQKNQKLEIDWFKYQEIK